MPTVLIVDDELGIADLLADILRAEGYKAEAAGTVPIAISIKRR